MKILVALPTYNEAENIEGVVAAVLSSLPSAEILIVDDDSPDGTGDIASKLAEADERIHVLRRPRKAGLGSAYKDAFRWALHRDFDAVVEMDADFSHDPADLPRLASSLAEADLVIGSRYVSGGSVVNWSALRLALSRLGNLYASTLLRLRLKDATSGYRIYSRSLLESIDLDSVRTNGYAFQVEMAYRAIVAGFRVSETPITFTDRRVGQSKMSGSIVLEALLWVAQEATNRAARKLIRASVTRPSFR